MANYPASTPTFELFESKTFSITEGENFDDSVIESLGRSFSSPDTFTNEVFEVGLVGDGDGAIAGPAGAWAIGD